MPTKTGKYTDSDPGLRRDRSTDNSGNPREKPRELGRFIETLDTTKLPGSARDDAPPKSYE